MRAPLGQNLDVPHDLRVITYEAIVACACRHFLRGPSFCILFDTHVPFGAEQNALYRNHGKYVSAVTHADSANVEAGFLRRPDARENHREAAHSSVGK